MTAQPLASNKPRDGRNQRVGRITRSAPPRRALEPRMTAAGTPSACRARAPRPPRSRRRPRSASSELVARRVAVAAEITERGIPATPSATSVVPWRHGRPNESLTITPTSTPARSRSRSRRSAGRRVRIEREEHERARAGALDASTPALAQRSRACVCAITSGGRERTIRDDFPEDTSSWAGSPSGPASARPLGRLDHVEGDDRALDLRDRLPRPRRCRRRAALQR